MRFVDLADGGRQLAALIQQLRLTIGHLAEAAWHHPDLTVSYAFVIVKLMNHFEQVIRRDRIQPIIQHDLAALVIEFLGDDLRRQQHRNR